MPRQLEIVVDPIPMMIRELALAANCSLEEASDLAWRAWTRGEAPWLPGLEPESDETAEPT